MYLDDIKWRMKDKLSARLCLGMFEVIDLVTEECLKNPVPDHNTIVALVQQNQYLYEHMKASKELKWAREIQAKLVNNRNLLFVLLINDYQQDFESIFKYMPISQ